MNGLSMNGGQKYGSRKTVVDGIVFDSKREANRWYELKLLERVGEVTELQRQVTFELIPRCGSNRPTTYVADFVYMRKGKKVVEDAKGYRTEVYRIKRKLMRWVHGIDVREA